MNAGADELAARLAQALTAEAVWGQRSLAGAVVVAAAACVAGHDLAAVRRLPAASGRERRVVLQRAHAGEVEGVPLLQLLALAGAEPVEVGTAWACSPDELSAILARGAAAGLFLAPAAAAEGAVDLPRFAWACRAAGVPAVVVCGPGLGPLAALDAGAELALFDPAALCGGPPAGLVAGAAARVAACALQDRGLGALFRVDSGVLEAALLAIEAAARDPADGRALPPPTRTAAP